MRTLILAWSAVAACVLGGCDRSEGSDPGMGVGVGEGGVDAPAPPASDDGGVDAACVAPDSGVALATCGPYVVDAGAGGGGGGDMEGCPCGPPHDFEQVLPIVDSTGTLVSLDFTPAGRMAAIEVVRDCSADPCEDVVTIRRGDTARMPAPGIELGRFEFAPGIETAVAGEVLTLVWKVRRVDDPALGEIWFARLDVASGTWVDAPRLAFTPGDAWSDTMRIALGPAGHAVTWTGSGERAGQIWFRGFGLDGAPTSADVMVAAPPGATYVRTEIAPRSGGGFGVLSLPSGEILRFHAVDGSGSPLADPVEVSATPNTAVLRARSGGFDLALNETAFGDAHLARLDPMGTVLVTTPWPHSVISHVLPRSDGATWVFWRTPCVTRGMSPEPSVLSLIAADGTRMQDDVPTWTTVLIEQPSGPYWLLPLLGEWRMTPVCPPLGIIP